MIAYDASELQILEVRAKRVLVKLALLANGDIAQFDATKQRHQKTAASSPPRGIRLNGSASHELSPFEYFDNLFTAEFADLHRGDDRAPERIEVLLGRAHAAYRMAVSRGLLDERRDFTTDRDNRILTRYQGMHYEWVAAVEDCSGMSVRRLREKDGQDPTYGLMEDAGIKCEHCGHEDFEQANKAGVVCPECGNLMSRVDALAA